MKIPDTTPFVTRIKMAAIDIAIERTLHTFGISCLKKEQANILMCLMENKDCMAVLPTGYGKSLPFQMCLEVKRQLKMLTSQEITESEKVIVCSPLLSLMQDQVSKMRTIYGDRVAYKGESATYDLKIKDGQVDLIYASPETLVGDHLWRSAISKFNVGCIVVDEFHTLATWGEDSDGIEKKAFRKWFSHVGELRSLFPGACMLALSATCTQKIRKSVTKILNLKEDLEIISVSPNKQNIKLVAQKIPKALDTAMCWLVDGISKLKGLFPKTLIYCSTYKDMASLYTYLITELPELSVHIEMFHAETCDEQKKALIKSLTSPQSFVRVVIASTALGMGVNIVDCHTVIVYGAPPSVVDLIQEIGRVGRDGQASVAIMLHNPYHLLRQKDIKNVYKSTTCRRLCLMGYFLSKNELDALKLETGNHSCCDICAHKCICGNCQLLEVEKLLNLDSFQSVSSSSSSSPVQDIDASPTLYEEDASSTLYEEQGSD